ncbi:uncharacterized protein LOC120725323 isoform X4 [Simochromis diagramma]|uniref:uncharacterized protein LOC120725323 isoform X4 n=1 Tax=Simochromis diagramma TaxID=43689 RepID=UPI001A7EEC12|nr:uncharacterized protein LOC120725323 isoform X4 [Simochromis diagramma]
MITTGSQNSLYIRLCFRDCDCHFCEKQEGERQTMKTQFKWIKVFSSVLLMLQVTGWWMFIVVLLGLLALIISAVIAIRWKRAKGKKMETNENPELNLNPAVTPSAPGTIQESAAPEYPVPYASISYTNNTTSKTRVRDKNEGERVTYSTVKASSMDPSNLYDTIK